METAVRFAKYMRMGAGMYENEEYVFCPECGALMKDGVCMSCGRGKATEQEAAGGWENMQADENGSLTGQNEPSGGGPAGADSGSGYVPARPAGGDSAAGSMPGARPADYGVLSADPTAGSGMPGTGPAGYGTPTGAFAGGTGAQGMPPYGYGVQPGTSAGGYGMPGAQPGTSAGGYDTPGAQPGNPVGGPGMPGMQPGGYGAGNGTQSGSYGTGNVGGYGMLGGNRYTARPGWNGGNPSGFDRAGDYGYWNGPQNGYGRPGQMTPYGPAGGEEHKNNRVIAAAVIAVITVLVCIVMVLLFFIVRDSARSSGANARNKDYFFGSPREENDGGGREGWIPNEDEDKEEENYIPDAADDYYVTLADSVREDLSYHVEWEEYDNVDDDTGATAVGRYPRIEGGNIPHLEELNKAIRDEATYYSNLYGYYREWGDATLFASESMGYVTYMDEEKISIVLQESIATDEGSSISLYSINIDLIGGEIMNNGRIIEYSMELARAFRDQNDYQNGYVEAVELMSDEKLQDFLSDEDTNIVFYTPVGLEIGFNYTTSDSTGWVTATIKDYERYRQKF